MSRLFQALAEAAEANSPVALAILVRVKGSSPQKTGAKALFYPDRKIAGTLGGGCLEAEAQRLALEALGDGQPKTFELVLDHDYGWDDGLICGGKVSGVIVPGAEKMGAEFWRTLADRTVERVWGVDQGFVLFAAEPGAPLPPEVLYRETISPPCAMWIAGSGHIAAAVAPLAAQLDFAVSIFDDRPELANERVFPQAEIHTGSWEKILKQPFPRSPVFGLIVTRGHKHDAVALEYWIHRPFRFLGMIGSERKARTLTDFFVKQRLASAEEMARVACPVGIRIRSRSVMEIAVDILAQYIDQRAAALEDI